MSERKRKYFNGESIPPQDVLEQCMKCEHWSPWSSGCIMDGRWIRDCKYFKKDGKNE